MTTWPTAGGLRRAPARCLIEAGRSTALVLWGEGPIPLARGAAWGAGAGNGVVAFVGVGVPMQHRR